jgi:hypothetical protein
MRMRQQQITARHAVINRIKITTFYTIEFKMILVLNVHTKFVTRIF